MAKNRQYDHEYKVQAVKPAKEIGQAKAAKELEVPRNTMYGWEYQEWKWQCNKKKLP